MKIDKIDNDTLTFYSVYIEPEEAKKWLTQAYFDIRRQDAENQQLPSYERLGYQDLLQQDKLSIKRELFSKAITNHIDDIIEALGDTKVIKTNFYIQPNGEQLGDEGFYLLLHGYNDDSKYILSQEKIQEVLGDQELFYDQIAEKYLSQQVEDQYRLEPVEKEIDLGDYARLTLKQGDRKISDIFHFGLDRGDREILEIQNLFDLALKAKKKGDKFELMTNPEVTCKVEQVYELEIPEIDDEFVSEISEYDTIEEFKKNFASPDNIDILKYEMLETLNDYLWDLGVYPDRSGDSDVELTKENRELIKQLNGLGWTDISVKSKDLVKHLNDVPTDVFYNKLVDEGVTSLPKTLSALTRGNYLDQISKIEDYLVGEYLKDIREKEIENEDN